MSAAIQVAQQIRQQISSGIYQPGDRLPRESELSANFRVGRNTVREAIARLRYARLVYTRQGSGTYVLDNCESGLFGGVEQMPLLDEIVMVYDYRIALESTAAAMAAASASAEQIDQLVEFNQQIHQAIRENTSGTMFDVRFHQMIMQATDNQLFVQTFNNYQQPFERVIYAARVNSGTTAEHMQAAYDEHLKIVQGIRTGDQDFAAQAMSIHLRSARHRLMQTAESDHEQN